MFRKSPGRQKKYRGIYLPEIGHESIWKCDRNEVDCENNVISVISRSMRFRTPLCMLETFCLLICRQICCSYFGCGSEGNTVRGETLCKQNVVRILCSETGRAKTCTENTKVLYKLWLHHVHGITFQSKVYWHSPVNVLVGRFVFETILQEISRIGWRTGLKYTLLWGTRDKHTSVQWNHINYKTAVHKSIVSTS